MILQKKAVYKIATIVLAIIFIVFLLSQISIKDIIDTLFSLNPFILAAGFSLYACTYLLRAFRFSLLLNRVIGIRDVFPIVCVHGLMVNLLPSRAGEVSYIYLLKKIHGRTTGEGVATLVVARIFDFIVLILLLFTAGLFIHNVPDAFLDFMWVISIVLFTLMGILISLLYYGERVVQLLYTVFQHFNLENTKPARFIFRNGDEIIHNFQSINFKRDGPLVCLISVLIWLASYTNFYFILLGLGIIIPFQNFIFGAVLILLAGVIPTPNIAGFGTGQAIFTLVFVPLGIPLESAIVSAFSWHIILIVFTLILGIFGTVILKKQYIPEFKLISW